jgi:thioredoxin 1
MAINSVIHTNIQSIDRVLRAGLPLLLVFWQRSVAQSTELDSVLNELAGEHAGRALIVKIDAEDEKELVKRYDIRLLPSVVAIDKRGQVESTLPGRIADQSLRDWLAYLIHGGARPAVASGPGIPTSTGQPLHTNGKSAHTASQPATVHHAAAGATSKPSQPSTQQSLTPQTLTDANFDKVINSKVPVLVDFWAEWCGPCRMVAPSVEQLAKEFAGRAVVGKLNVDHNPNTARRYQIMSIPALFIFKDGQVIDRIVGAQPLPVLRQRLERAVAGQ